MPTEAALSAEAREELEEAARAGLSRLRVEPEPAAVVEALCTEVERAGVGSKTQQEKVIFELGALYGSCLEMQLGWEWVEVTWDSLTAMALVPLDRSLAILPIHAVGEQVEGRPVALQQTFERLAAGELPPETQRNQYALLLP